MTRTMYDSTVAASIPPTAQMVAGYVDGLYVWAEEDWNRFPDAVKVRIAVNPATNDGHVLDVEPGNWDDQASVAWVKMRRAAGVEPSIYCGNWAPGYTCGELPAIFAAAGEAMPQVWVSDTTQDGTTIPDGCIACQFAITPGYDISIVADYWPGVDAAPVPVPDGPDIPDAQTDIANARALMAQADTLLEHAHEDLNSSVAGALPKQPPPVVLGSFSTSISSSSAPDSITYTYAVLPVAQEAPVDPPPVAQRGTLPSWTLLALSLLALAIQEALTVLHALPQSTPVAIALIVLAGIGGFIVGAEQIMQQYSAHALQMAALRRQ